MTGAQAVVRSLEALGVTDVFGLPGGAVLPLYDALTNDHELRHILVRHEQGAGHAAEGFAAATGRVGVCIATSGPGATNLVTAIADAHMDSVPMLAITGQVFSHLMGTDAFQEVDIAGITMPITVENTWPVIATSGTESMCASAIAVTRFVAPGPLVAMHTPTPPVAAA